jgi:uncharacterized Tic20 family protein
MTYAPEEGMTMTIADELQKLQHLRDSGTLSDEEFASAKRGVLTGLHDVQPAFSSLDDSDVGPLKDDRATRQWGFILHMSMLAAFLLPLAGLIVPIVIWQLKKDKLPGLDEHGKNAVNWLISAGIYAVVSVLMVLVIVGIPMLIALGIASIVFPIVAAIKANNGELWKYPLSITFLR